MKDRILRFGALLLLIWYSLSIIGFDVHTCKASDRSFVATFLSGLACEDIHPEHDCCDHEHHGCCCHHDKNNFSADERFQKESCCTDDYLSLTITGDSSGEKFRTSVLSGPSICPVITRGGLRCLQTSGFKILFKPDPGLIVFEDVLSFISFWRI